MNLGDEKEVALLGTMARTLEKLIDLDRKEQGEDASPKRERELVDIKRKLAARIDHLRNA